MPDLLSGKLVVVIDDDRLILDAMGGLLRGWGCRVVTADSGSAALTGLIAYGQAPDLIMSDYNLPGTATGADVIRRLRSTLGIAIPAVLISGEGNPERLREAGESGLHILRKPVSPVTLEAMLKVMLHNDGRGRR